MTISVVIPFYNLEGYVRPCLDSVVTAFSRTMGRWDVRMELICVDDGSSDSTGGILDEYAVRYQGESAAGLFVRALHKENGGEGSARNAGVEASSGGWVTYLDGDDVWLENHLEAALPLLETYSDADIIALKYAQFVDGDAMPAPTTDSVKEIEVDKSVPSEVLFEVGVFPTFFRRDFLRAGEFSPLPLGADRLYMAQCFARARKIVKCDAVVHGYRIRAGSMARAVWDARKVVSQCRYAHGSLVSLGASGKALGKEGVSYLSSLWLSDVPNRLARIPAADRRVPWEEWRATLTASVPCVPPRYELVRRILRRLSFSMFLSVAAAKILRKGGIS